MSILKNKGGLAAMAEESHHEPDDRYYNDPFDLGLSTRQRADSDAFPSKTNDGIIQAPPPVAAPAVLQQTHSTASGPVEATITSEQAAAKLQPQTQQHANGPSRRDSRRTTRPGGDLIPQPWTEYAPEPSLYGGPPGPYRSPRNRDAFYDDYSDADWYDYDYPRFRQHPYRRRPTREIGRPGYPGSRLPPHANGVRPSLEEPFLQKKHPRFDEGYESEAPRSEYGYGGDHYGGGGGGHGGRRPRSLRDVPPGEVLRLPWTMWMNSNAKNHFVAALGEFVGTAMFLFFAFAGTQVADVNSQAASDSNTSTNASTGFSPIVLLYISLVFAFSLMVNVWVFFRISGGLFNPAVTLAMLMTGTITIIRAILLLIAQLAGAIFASYIVSVLFPTSFNVRTTLADGTSLVRGVFIEALLTAELVFTIFMLAKEKHKATFIAPVGIGLALFIGELVGVYYTGGSLNPARSFGPCVVTATFDAEHWIYWVGPAIGAVIAVVFYKFIKTLEYEAANPGQDHSPDKNAKKDEESRLEKEATPTPSERPKSRGSEKA